MVTYPSSEVGKSAFRNERDASLGVMFNLFPVWIWALNDRFKSVRFTWPAHLPREVEGNMYIFFLCVCVEGGGYSGKVKFAILEYIAHIAKLSPSSSFSWAELALFSLYYSIATVTSSIATRRARWLHFYISNFWGHQPKVLCYSYKHPRIIENSEQVVGGLAQILHWVWNILYKENQGCWDCFVHFFLLHMLELFWAYPICPLLLLYTH
jgi:hypothetical protein